MVKNLWQHERQFLFRELVKQYIEEGYVSKEAKKLAKQEVSEIMVDKEDFIQHVWKESFRDV
jgi:hypothetical protein